MLEQEDLVEDGETEAGLVLLGERVLQGDQFAEGDGDVLQTPAFDQDVVLE